MSPSCCKPTEDSTDCCSVSQTYPSTLPNETDCGVDISSNDFALPKTPCKSGCCGTEDASKAAEKSIEDEKKAEPCNKCEELNPQGGAPCCDGRSTYGLQFVHH